MEDIRNRGTKYDQILKKNFQTQIFPKKFFLRKRTFEVLCTNVWDQVVFEIVRRKVP